MRACSRPSRLAMRGRSWLPRTQLGQPPAGKCGLVFVDQLADRGGMPRCAQQRKVERQMRAAQIARRNTQPGVRAADRFRRSAGDL